MKINDATVTIIVSDMSRSVLFYESIGFTIKNRWENHYAMLTVPGLTIGLHPSKGETMTGAGNTSIGLVIDSGDEATALLKKLDVKIESRQGQAGYFISFTDPDGTELYFVVLKKEYK